MEIQQNKFAFFANFAETIRCLPEEKQAPAYKALCEYGIYGILPEDESLRIMCLMSSASVFKEDGRKNNGGNHNPKGINQHTNSGQSRSNLVNSGQSLSKQETETETETETEKESVERKPKNDFSPPTLEQVLEYARQQNEMAFVGGFKCSQQTATEFFYHYDAIGWVIGNETKTPIKNWQSKLRLWALSPNKYKTKQELDDDIPDAPICVAR